MNRLTLILTLLIMNTFAFASPESDVQAHLMKYYTSFRKKDINLLKSLVSKKFYQKLQKDGTIKKAFSLQKKRKIEEIDFKTVKAVTSKNTYFVNSKRKQEKEYGHYWYKVKVINKRMTIEDMIMMEEHPH